MLVNTFKHLLGYFMINHIFGCLSCISMSKECYQNCFLEVHRGAVSFVTLASLFFQKTYLATFLTFLLQPCNLRTPSWADMWDQSKHYQKC